MPSKETYQHDTPAMKFPVMTVIAICGVCAAAAILLAALRYAKPTPAGLCRSAQVKASLHRFDSAQDLLQKALTLQSDYAPAHLQLAQVLMQKRAFAEALEHYHQALVLDPMLAATTEFKNLLMLAADVEEHDGFLAAYMELAGKIPAGTVGPVHTAAFDLAARIHFSKFLVQAYELSIAMPQASSGRIEMVADDAIRGRFEPVRQTIAGEYDGALAEELQERVIAAEKHCQAAQQMMRKAAELEPKFAAARLGMAMIATQMRSPDQGLQIVLDVLAGVQSPRPSLLLYAALLLERVNRFDTAEKLLRQVRDKDPENPHARYLWAGVLLHKGDLKGLKPLVDELLQNNPSENRAVFLKGTIDLLEGRYDDAAKYLGSVQGDLGGWDTLEYYRMLANYRTGNIAQARSSRLVAQHVSAFPEALLARAALAIDANDPADAVAACRALFAKTLRDSEAVRLSATARLVVRATMAAAADEPADAVAACQALFETKPRDPDTLRLLAVAQLMQRRPKQVIATLREYLRSRPDSPREMQALAAARMATGELNEVIAEYEQTAKQADAPPVIHRVLAFAYSLAGRQQEAEEQYRSLLQFDASQPDYWLFRARRLAIEGRANALDARAVAECRAGLARGASAPELLATSGVLNTMAGRFADARDELAIATTAPAASQFIVDVYFALASHPNAGGPATAAAEILTADPFSHRSYDLLIIAYSQGMADGNLRDGLDKLARGRPGLVSLLNRSVVLRRQEAIHECSRYLVDLESLWPRLTEVHKNRGLDWM